MGKIALCIHSLSFPFLVVAAFCCPIFIVADGVAECPKSDVVCPLVPVLITESPTGTVNGFNNDFSLLHLPNNQSAVRLFLNGLELRQGPDYRISGSDIIVIRPDAIKQGDVLVASYETTASPSPASLNDSRRHQELIHQVLMREAEKERQAYAPSQPANSSGQKRDLGLAVTPPSIVGASRALKMLNEQLVRSSLTYQQKPVIPALDGLEGLGDISTPSSYSELLGPDSSVLGVIRASSVAGLPVRSFSMLANILKETESTDSGREK